MQNEHMRKVALCEARLFFIDPTYGLNVESGQFHRTYAETPYDYDGVTYGYDGIDCFDMADYEKLKSAFMDLTAKGEQSHLWFRLADASNPDKSLYSGGLNQLEHEGDLVFSFDKCFGKPELFVECEAYLKKPDAAEKVIDLMYGGMLATEIDYLGKDENNQANTPAVQLYRQWEASGMSPSAFILSQLVRETKQTLMKQIQSAEKAVQGERRNFRRYVDKEGKAYML